MRKDHYVRNGTEEAGYEIWIEIERRLLRMHLWGSWREALAHAYSADLDARYLYFGHQSFAVLVDARGAPIQIPAVKVIRGEAVAKALVAGMKRVAYLTSELLPMWQARRMAQASGCAEAECFETEAQALVWLERGGPVENGTDVSTDILLLARKRG